MFAPHELSGENDIVGWPTFHNYNFERSFWTYRLSVFAFPVLLFVTYLLLRRFGPIRQRHATSRHDPVAVPVRLPEPPAAEGAATRFRLGVLPRLAVPVGVAAVAVSTPSAQTGVRAAIAVVLYLLAVVVAAGLWSWFTSRSLRTAFWDGVAWANGAGGATVALLGLWLVSKYTVIAFVDGPRVYWPWLPLWLAVAGIGATLLWTIRQYRAGRSARDTELTLLTIVVGATALFLALSALPGQVDTFYSLDTGQDLAGASLMSRGELPWRDFLFIHGLFADGIRASVGFAVFEPTAWGAYAGVTVLLAPLTWVLLYLYVAWFTRRNPWFLTFVAVATVGLLLPWQYDGVSSAVAIQRSTTFMFVPVSLVVFGEMIRRRSTRWAAGLAVLLFIQAILVPETSLLVLSVIGCLVAADLVHREPGTSLWRSLRYTRWFAVAGATSTAVFLGLLAVEGAVRPFIEYYIVVGPGHAAAGAFPFDGRATPPNGLPIREYLELAAAAVAALLTFFTAARRFIRRQPWEPLDWVALCTAGWIALYTEKAVARFDVYHVWQVFSAALVLILIWLWKLARTIGETGVLTSVRWPGMRRPALRLPAAATVTNAVIAAGLAVVVLVSAGSLVPWARNIDKAHLKYTLSPPRGNLGYAYDHWPRLLEDLDTALRTYAGPDGAVFDMTNSPGIYYHALNRLPGTRFVHASMAVPPFAQRLLIDELEQSRPPVIAYHSSITGDFAWDRIGGDVRHYQVSQYILENWVPVVRTIGTLLLLRRDLVTSAPPLPVLTQRPETSDLWFTIPSCDWGTTANFLPFVATGESLRLPVEPVGRRLVVAAEGWVSDGIGGAPATIVVTSGNRVVNTISAGEDRPDRAEDLDVISARRFRFTGVVPDDGPVGVYVVGDDNLLHPIAGAPRTDAPAIVFPDGRVVATASTQQGWLHDFTSQPRTVGRIDVPAGVTLTDYSLATLASASGPVGGAQVALIDRVGFGDRAVGATARPGTRRPLPLRVGSCLQWRGYDATKPLYVTQDGGETVTSVTLSGVAD